MSDLFDDLLDEAMLDENTEPYHKIDKKKESDKLDWLKKVKNALLEQAQSRTATQRMHLSWYRGISPHKWERNREYQNAHRINKINKFIVNHLYDLTETKVSQMTRLKPAVQVLPANDEYNDRGAAKVAGAVINHIWDLNNIDFMIQQMHRHARIFGESFCFVTWNPNKGDLHPEYVKVRDSGMSEAMINGKIMKVNEPVKTGDVEYELEMPWRVLLQRKSCMSEVDYCFRIKVVPTEDLKLDYPSKKDKINNKDELRVFDIEDLTHKYVEGHTVVYEFWHKKTKYLPEGKRILMTDDCILEQGDLPFNHGQLPFIRLTDMDVPDVLNGVSRYETAGPIQKMYDNISTLIAKNIYLTAHAKWMMPRGACKIEQLGNDNTIVQYQGPIAPQLAQVQPNPIEVYSFREKLKEDMQTIYGSHGISRGEVPKGITAASALQFLNELENGK